MGQELVDEDLAEFQHRVEKMSIRKSPGREESSTDSSDEEVGDQGEFEAIKTNSLQRNSLTKTTASQKRIFKRLKISNP